MSNIHDFIIKVYNAAQGGEVDPVFTTAQAGLESGWGAHAPGNNFFGITKGSNWNGKVQLLNTIEYFSRDSVRFAPPETVLSITKLEDGRYMYRVKRLFKVFDSMSDCLAEHERLFRKPIYADAWPYRKDPVEFARRITDEVGGKYATAANYFSKLKSAIDMVKKEIGQDEKG